MVSYDKFSDEDVSYLEEWCLNLQEIARNVKKNALQKNLTTFFSITSTFQYGIIKPYITPIRILESGLIFGVVIYSPTQAIIAPYQLDARKCISYLTIENKESIPLHMRKPIGNRIFGCDDCQSFCPWNKFAKSAVNTDFKPNPNILDQPLEKLFLWSEKEWDKNTRGTALRRSGFNGWLRNIAVALGNSKTTSNIKTVLKSRLNVDSEMLHEHIIWALKQH